ncbi:hypothetical protein CEXT_279551 [Caerostris extrusa]|uniref:Uncharacterized protein n=1 Tax=Caerostris extrusa TaxID=172846 RepID=A0AAV4X0N8_CAEEX|nr:hypothetical protein CEXT_279551 [Caerostris extrusa]
MHYHAICFCPKTTGKPISLAELAGTSHFWKANRNTSIMKSSSPHFEREGDTGSCPRSRGRHKVPFLFQLKNNTTQESSIVWSAFLSFISFCFRGSEGREAAAQSGLGYRFFFLFALEEWRAIQSGDRPIPSET